VIVKAVTLFFCVLFGAARERECFASEDKQNYELALLNGIHLVDFGNHRDTRLTFGRMTALVGQNGAGKTNVMKAIL